MEDVTTSVSSLTFGVGAQNDSPLGTTLSKVSPDSLSLILDLVSTECIGKLWLCGDSGLCRSMRFGGVRKFRKEMMDGVFDLRWPSLVSNFTQLVEFQMSCPVSCMRKPRPRFETLPHGLQVLELGQGFVRRFLDSDHFNLLPHLVSLRLPETCALIRFEVEQIPPRLYELRIALDANDCLLSLSKLACAPTLIILSLHIEQHLPNVEISLEHMPTLEKLKIEVDAARLLLPKSVTNLKSTKALGFAYPLPFGLLTLSARFSSFSKETLDGVLPRSLTELEMWIVGRVEGASSLNPLILTSEDAFRMLPPNLTTFKVPYKPEELRFSADFCSKLAHLKTLAIDFGLGKDSYPWRHQCAQNRDPFKDTYASRPILPDSLTEYSALGGRNDDALPLVWPESLATLRMGAFAIRPGDGSNGMNTNNQNSGSNGSANSSSDGRDEMKHFSETGTRIRWPPSLAHLSTRIVDLRVTERADSGTPRSLEELMKEREERLDSVLVVPKTLVSLAMDSPSLHLPINCILPPRLRSLDLNMHSESGVYSILQWPPGWSALLPETITHLRVIVPSSCYALGDEWLKNLKLPHLTSLDLPRFVQADPKLLHLLPSPLLANLKMSFEADIPWLEMKLDKFQKLEQLHLASRSSKSYPKTFLDLLPKSIKAITFGGTVSSNIHPEIIEKCRSKHISFAYWGNP